MISFDEARPHLFAVAYRMLGSAADADDAVQEAFVRVCEHPDDDIRSPRALLTTVVTRVCLDVLKSARRKREVYVGPWLPEPIATEDEIDRDSVSLAFLLLLERLTPAERATYLLVEVFDHSHAEVAAILGKEEATVRKLFSRAKAHMGNDRSRFSASAEEHLRLLSSFVAAASGGDLDGLRALLADDVAVTTDGGGKARAARKTVRGADASARMLLGLAKKGAPNAQLRFVDVNGVASMGFFVDGVLFTLVVIEVADGLIRHVFNHRNPDKLGRLSRELGGHFSAARALHADSE